jgi:hypothetical protein
LVLTTETEIVYCTEQPDPLIVIQVNFALEKVNCDLVEAKLLDMSVHAHTAKYGVQIKSLACTKPNKNKSLACHHQ